MNGEPSTTILRLAAARRRVRAFIDQISELEASDFPHEDGRKALSFIKDFFSIRQNLLRDLPSTANDTVIDQICLDTSFNLSRHTEILGFILRSTNLRNAFELHFPLKRLIKEIISPEAQLIMSSEWKFVPFTYPMNIDLLPDFVLVGGPAPESGNVLIVPLAGHEIGHSAWRSHKVAEKIQTSLIQAIAEVIDADAAHRDKVLNQLQRASLNLSHLQNSCLTVAIKQLEEIFCDYFGLYVFGLSYLYAYEYFLAPGGGNRDPFYPSSSDRVKFLLDAARELKLSADADLFSRWLDSKQRPGIDGEVLIIADRAVAKVVPELRKFSFELLQAKGIALNDSDAINRVLVSFRGHVPDGAGATLAEIVTAGWRYLREAKGLSNDENRAEYEMLSELMLKSVEVSEFLLRVSPAGVANA